MQASLEAMEMGNQRDADVGDVSEPEVEFSKEENLQKLCLK